MEDLPSPEKLKYVWKSPYDFNNTFAVPHVYALTYNGTIKYVGQSTGTRANYYTGGVIPRRKKVKGIKGVLEFCTIEELNSKEIYYIDKLKPEYNICSGGQNRLLGDQNPARRPEVRRLISEKRKGSTATEATRIKLREAKLRNPTKHWKGIKQDKLITDKIKQTYSKKYQNKYKKIEELILKGWYVKEIVRELSVSSATIAKVKKQLGLSGKHNRKRKEKRS